MCLINDPIPWMSPHSCLLIETRLLLPEFFMRACHVVSVYINSAFKHELLSEIIMTQINALNKIYCLKWYEPSLISFTYINHPNPIALSHTKSLHMPKWTSENHLGCGCVSPWAWLLVPIVDAVLGKARGLAAIVYPLPTEPSTC